MTARSCICTNAIRHSQEEFLSKLDCLYPPNFCMGLLAFYPEIADLELIERTLERAGTFDWCLSQNVFPVLINAQSPWSAGHYLDSSEYQDVNTLQSGAVFRHYWGSGLMTWDNLRQTYIDDTRKFYFELGVGL